MQLYPMPGVGGVMGGGAAQSPFAFQHAGPSQPQPHLQVQGFSVQHPDYDQRGIQGHVQRQHYAYQQHQYERSEGSTIPGYQGYTPQPPQQAPQQQHYAYEYPHRDFYPAVPFEMSMASTQVASHPQAIPYPHPALPESSSQHVIPDSQISDGGGGMNEAAEIGQLNGAHGYGPRPNEVDGDSVVKKEVVEPLPLVPRGVKRGRRGGKSGSLARRRKTRTAQDDESASDSINDDKDDFGNGDSQVDESSGNVGPGDDDGGDGTYTPRSVTGTGSGKRAKRGAGSGANSARRGPRLVAESTAIQSSDAAGTMTTISPSTRTGSLWSETERVRALRKRIRPFGMDSAGKAMHCVADKYRSPSDPHGDSSNLEDDAGDRGVDDGGIEPGHDVGANFDNEEERNDGYSYDNEHKHAAHVESADPVFVERTPARAFWNARCGSSWYSANYDTFVVGGALLRKLGHFLGGHLWHEAVGRLGVDS
ncbi:hypothetical protein HDU93_007464 [Gonapodya sp. JEL0774]|nr:hypothetical protein HDU93_007464 [Gonapodya sp. JEL0774]